MQQGGETTPISPMQGSTSNPVSPIQLEGKTRVGVDNQSTQSAHEYINLDGEETVQTDNATETRDGENEVVLKRKRQKTSTVWEDFAEVTLPDGKKKAEVWEDVSLITFSGFLRYAEYEPHFSHLPSEKDWENVESVCEVLKVFKVCTNIISGSDYPTANLYLIEVYKVKETLDKGALSESGFIRDMVKMMKEKFDKYWGECHLFMAIASVLDPRFKMWLVNFCYPKLYPANEVEKNIKEVSDALDLMYAEYLEMHETSVMEASHRSGSSGGSNASRFNEDSRLGSGWEAFGEFIKDMDVERPEKSELKMYLEEGLLQQQGGTTFNVLEWWNVHKLKYRVLSKMAMDVLAIPISTIASEATFSAGGRVIDPYRSSLASDTVQMLICGGDWIRQLYGVKKKPKKEDIPSEVLLPTVKRS